MNPRYLPLVVLPLILGCDPDPNTSAMSPRSIDDGAHGGNASFFFLPPMVADPNATGTFDENHDPVVEICELSAGACVLNIATFDSSGQGSERVRVDEDDEHYHVNWHTKRFGLDPALDYRVTVISDGDVLGHADIDLLPKGSGKPMVAADHVGVRDGSTLPIKFRIESGDPDPCAGDVTFTDAALEGAVRGELGIPTGALTGGDMLGLTSLTARNLGIVSLQGLECATNLRVLNAHTNAITDISPLTGLDQLYVVWLYNNAGISDLSPLSGAVGMVDLRIHQSTTNPAAISDLSPLAGMTSMDALSVSGHDITDLSPLSGMTQMRSFQAHSNAITDITALTGHDQLFLVWLYNNAGISDLSPLSGAVGMVDLRINQATTNPTAISDLSPLAGMTSMDTLVVSGHDITDLSPLSGMTQMRNFQAHSNAITDITALTGHDQLFLVWLFNNAGISDLSPLSGATGMRDLRINQATTNPTAISDLSPLAGMTSMDTLVVSGHDITDLSPVSGMTQMRNFQAHSNAITDITALTGHDQLFLVWLFANAGISDLSPLAGATGMRDLRIQQSTTNPTAISDLSPLAGMTSMDTLAVSGHDIVDLSPVSGMTQMRSFQAHSNAITDTTPLVGACQLQTLWLQGNLYTCPDATIDALESCGVNVTSDC